MSILKIARMGHPILGMKSVPVEDPSAPEIGYFVDDMIDTLDDAGGVGLAAPQVHLPIRLVIFKVPDASAAAERYRAAGLEVGTEEVPLTVLMNPVIKAIGNETHAAYEGCLSIPDMSGEVHRPVHIRYTGIGLDGETIEREATGFHARVVQHECDHLDVILYPHRISDMRTFGYNDELRKSLVPKEEAEEDTP
ncbi:MAG: peptide deformylase [Rhodospirillaceae bacterium]|nr:peptide deformylase [Rhodospirillaceae bacterium]